MLTRRRHVLLLITAVLMSACSGSISDSNRQTLANAYTDILIARNLHGDDTVRRHTVVDSIARSYGFDDGEDVLAHIKELTKDPENLRRMLDSAQQRLERAQKDTATRKK